MRRLLLLVVLVALFASSAAPAAFAVTITISGYPFDSFVISSAGSISETNNIDGIDPIVPSAGTTFAGHGGSTSTVGYNLSNVGFDLTFDHRRESGLAYASSYASIHFSPDTDTGYAFSGAYASSDPDGRYTSAVRFSRR